MPALRYGFNLPTVDEQPEDVALRELAEQSTNKTAASASPESQVAANQIAADNAQSSRLSTLGIYVSNIGTKATEGLESLSSRFAALNPFSKAAAKAPTFQEIAAGASGSGISSTGLLSSAQRQALYDRTVPDASASAVNNALGRTQAQEDRSHIVTLADSEGYVLEFLVMPEIVENRTVEYEAVAPAQFPGAFQKYKGTSSVQWSINATLISRTSDEASVNLRHLNRLRGWTMPFFGQNTRVNFPTKVGAPPPVLKFKGLRKGIIGEVPVVITSLNWNWPKDVDYIPAQELVLIEGEQAFGKKNIPFPTVIQIAIQVLESFSTDEFNQFSLVDYRTGDLKRAFSMPLNQNALQNPVRGSPRTGSSSGSRGEAQTIAPFAGAFRGNRSDFDPAQRVFAGLGTSVAGGRGTTIPPTAAEMKAISEKNLGSVKFGGGSIGNSIQPPAMLAGKK